ncbi:MAG TPA: 50S ribosomal protein L4 [Candidatus Dormibacteraeota bacterium]|nr:50S ribosomal protein L4 [Candidatus Dormibacteraeota bacterium]
MAKTRTVEIASEPTVGEVDPSQLAVPRYDVNGERVGEVDLPASVFAQRPNMAVMHQALVRQLANARQGTASTKTRATVRGGGAKPYRQKGTGRARHGSIREPSMVGGATVFGPHPRSYRQRMPRKMRRLAVRSALSVKLAEGKVAVLDGFALEEPRTKAMVEFLRRVGVERSALVVLPAPNDVVARSMSNLPWAKPILAYNLNLHDIFTHEQLLIANDAVGVIAEVFAPAPARARVGEADGESGTSPMGSPDEVER